MKIMETSPEIMGGTPVFIGTRVPVQTLIDYLDAGDAINDFLDDFPTVSRDQAVQAAKLGRMEPAAIGKS